MEWGNGGREGEQRKGGASSAWPLPFSSAAGCICYCLSRSPLKSQIIHWLLECVTVSVWINSGLLSYIHWKEIKSSHTPAIIQYLILFMPCFVAKMSYIFSCISSDSTPPLLRACSCLSLACCNCFCCFLTFFSKPNQGFDSFYKCCQDAEYLQPTSFLSCLLA